MRLTEAERKVMEVVWEKGEVSAKVLSELLRERVQWSKTTSYTMISRCVDKGFLCRTEPNYICTAVYSREDASKWETQELLENHFQGSADLLVASLVGQ